MFVIINALQIKRPSPVARRMFNLKRSTISLPTEEWLKNIRGNQKKDNIALIWMSLLICSTWNIFLA